LKAPDSIKKFFSTLLKKPLLFAVVVFIPSVFLILMAVDNFVMPVFAGSFTREKEIPAVTGLEISEAEQKLRDAGFSVEVLPEGRYSAEVEAGKILVQYPAAGRFAKVGRTVRLTVCKGLREVAIPDLRGRSQKQAEMSIERSGFILGKIIKGSHESIPRGVVIRTVPEAGTVARVNDTVRIVISSGMTSGKILLPSFEGLSLDDALSSLDKLGFKVGKITRETGSENPSGTIITQSPMSGEYLTADSKIDLVISD
jgi:serine/threonine-protein kinase